MNRFFRRLQSFGTHYSGRRSKGLMSARERRASRAGDPAGRFVDASQERTPQEGHCRPLEPVAVELRGKVQWTETATGLSAREIAGIASSMSSSVMPL